MRRMFLSTSLLPIWLALFPACSVSNSDHCGNREGDATCSQQGDATPYCSICVADNNGCVAAVPEDRCLATTAAATSTSPGSSSTVDPGTTSIPGTTSGTTTPTTEPTTEPATTTGLTDTGSTTTPDTTTTGDPSTTSSETSTSTGTTVDTLDTLGSTSTTSGTDTGGTTEMGPMCGDNLQEGNEVCDGTDLDDETCKTLLPSKWGGGDLKCNPGCGSFNDSACCIGVGQKCKILDPADGACCQGLTCQSEGLGAVCKN